MSDYASDLAVFICCSDYTEEEADNILEMYFQRPLTNQEYAHCVCFIALAAYYWYIWAIYKQATGDSIDEWLLKFYRYAKQYTKKALAIIV